MKFIKWLSLSLLFFTYSSSFASQYCALIVGDKKDPLNVFWWPKKNLIDPARNNPNGVKLGSFNCFVYDSWQAADASIKDKIKTPILPTDEFLFLQLAHGWPTTGNPDLNDATQPANARVILDILYYYSKQAKVSAFLDSCYSGEFLRQRLMDDQNGYNSKIVMKNFCLTTSSTFMLPAQGGGFYLPKAGQNMFDFYTHKDSYRVSLQTSAPWSEAGLVEYLTQKEASPRKALTQLLAVSKKIYKNNPEMLKVVSYLADRKLMNPLEGAELTEYIHSTEFRKTYILQILRELLVHAQNYTGTLNLVNPQQCQFSVIQFLRGKIDEIEKSTTLSATIGEEILSTLYHMQDYELTGNGCAHAHHAWAEMLSGIKHKNFVPYIQNFSSAAYDGEMIYPQYNIFYNEYLKLLIPMDASMDAANKKLRLPYYFERFKDLQDPDSVHYVDILDMKVVNFERMKNILGEQVFKFPDRSEEADKMILDGMLLHHKMSNPVRDIRHFLIEAAIVEKYAPTNAQDQLRKSACENFVF